MNREPIDLSRHVKRSDKAVAIYHAMEADDDFDDTADILFQLVKGAADKYPGKKRVLLLDIDEHRNSADGFDSDAFELQQNFVIGFLGRWLSEASMPLCHVQMPKQHEDLPESLMVIPGPPADEREAALRSHAQATAMPIFDSETGDFVASDGSRGTPV